MSSGGAGAMAPGRGDRVITPSDEVANVMEVDGPDLLLVYRGALNPENARFTMRASLCALWLPDRPRPKPVRRPFPGKS